jgi:hypothetical protein
VIRVENCPPLRHRHLQYHRAPPTARTESSAEKDKVYAALGRLVAEGTLLFPPQVCEELERFHDEDDREDRAYLWAKEHRDSAIGDLTIEQLFDSVRAVQSVVDNLVDYDKASPGEDADPYVVGLALHLAGEGRNVTVITEERNDLAHKTSMGSACALLSLPALSMRVFLKHAGIWPKG